MAAEPRRNTGHRLPRRVGRYEAFLQIGSGGMARVYLAAPAGAVGPGEVVVVKVLRREAIEDEHVLALFMDEARIAMRLSHPNVIRTREVAAQPPDYLLAMDFEDGQSLLQVLRRLGRDAVPIDEHVHILTRVLAGLSYAHELVDEAGRPFGIVHRDVSPSNVLVCYSGEVKLLDFGIAKATGALAATQDGVVKGKLGYAAPEQCLGKPADPRSDIYAVGVMLWEAIAGRRRASGETWHSVLQARLDGAEPDLTDVRPDAPPALLAATAKALAAEPEDRYQTAREFQADLEGYLASRKARVGPARIAAMLESHFEQERLEQQQAIEEYLGSRQSGVSGQRRRVPMPGPLPPAEPGSSGMYEEEDTSRIPVDQALLMKSKSGSMIPPAVPVPPGSVRRSLPPPLPSAPPSSRRVPSVPSAAMDAAPPSSRRVSSIPSTKMDGAPPSSRRVPSVPSTAMELLARPSSTGTYAVIEEAGPIISVHASEYPDQAPRGRRSKGSAVLVALLGVVLAAGAGFVVKSRSESRGPAQNETREPARAVGQAAVGTAAAAAANPSEVKVRITVDPPNAQLRLDGRALNGNPFVSVFPKEATIHELSASADGYRDEKQVLQFVKDVDVSITLHHARASARPAAPHGTIAPSAAASAMKGPEEHPSPSVEPGMELGTHKTSREKHGIDEKDPYSQ